MSRLARSLFVALILILPALAAGVSLAAEPQTAEAGPAPVAPPPPGEGAPRPHGRRPPGGRSGVRPPSRRRGRHRRLPRQVPARQESPLRRLFRGRVLARPAGLSPPTRALTSRLPR